MSRAVVLVVLALAAGAVGAVAGGADADADADPGAPSRSSYWVFFRDHGDPASLDSALTEATRSLTPRALARRAKARRERGESAAAPMLVDPRDLEPVPSYISAVAGAGAVLRTRSRWLNAVSVDADARSLAAIRAFAFVSDVRPVAAAAGARAMKTDAMSYGPGTHQLEMLGVPEAHALGYRGEGVLVCVLDSGFDLGHEAFDALEVRAQRDFVFRDDDTSYDPKQDRPNQSAHGTTVLSSIAGYAPGKLIGPAYRAEYLLGKTERIGSETRAEEDAWCAAVEWAEAMGADLLTSSLSYPYWYRPQDRDGRTAVNTRAANIAFERGLLIVNSSGNAGPGELSLSPPADALGVVSVGAVDSNGRLTAFSSIGPTWDRRIKPDLVAMGSGVTVVIPRTRDRYGRGSGTSYSAPLVAGCAAIVLSAHPDWGPEAVREALAMSADRASKPDFRYGWGIPNARDALLYPALEGRVADFHTGEPIGEARVRWQPAGSVDSTRAAPSDSPPRGTARTDSAGSYVVPNLPPGSYRLRIDAPGYFEWESEALQVPPSLGDVNVRLRYRGE